MNKVIVITFCFLAANAQNFDIKFGLGKSRFGSFDTKGFNSNLSLHQNKKIGLGIYFEHASASHKYFVKDLGRYSKPYSYFNNRSIKSMIGLKYKLNVSKLSQLSLGIYGGGVKYNHIGVASFILNQALPSDQLPNDVLYLMLPPEYDSGLTFGALSKIEYNYRVSKNILLGLDYGIQVYGGTGERGLGLFTKFYLQ